MAGWKVFFIFALGCVCLGLATATLVMPMSLKGAEMWMWLGGLLTGTIVAGVLLTLFLKHAGRDLDFKPRGGRS